MCTPSPSVLERSTCYEAATGMDGGHAAAAGRSSPARAVASARVGTVALAEEPRRGGLSMENVAISFLTVCIL